MHGAERFDLRVVVELRDPVVRGDGRNFPRVPTHERDVDPGGRVH